MSDPNKIIYPAATIGVVLDKTKNSQKFLGSGQVTPQGVSHESEITSLALSFDKKLVATGESGKEPTICIWKTDTCEGVVSFKQGVGINTK